MAMNNKQFAWNEEDIGYYGLNPNGQMAGQKKGTYKHNEYNQSSFNENAKMTEKEIQKAMSDALKEIKIDLDNYEKEQNYHMQLYKLLVVNALTWGIPAIPTYYLYELSKPFVRTPDDFAGQVIGLVCVFAVLLAANHEIFWNKYYHKYLTEDTPKENKEKTKEII